MAGKIQDVKNGESAFNAAVRIAETGKGTYTDFDGYYSLQGIDPGTYTLEIQLLGYQKTSISGVQIEAGKTTSIDVALKPASEELGEITISAEAIRNSVAAIQLTQKNSSVVLEGVSSEQIRRMPDNNSADIPKRTSGTTVESEIYHIKGLNDRYNLAMVNGAIMPASERSQSLLIRPVSHDDDREHVHLQNGAGRSARRIRWRTCSDRDKKLSTEDYIRKSEHRNEPRGLPEYGDHCLELLQISGPGRP